jgi:hypothetical protein
LHIIKLIDKEDKLCDDIVEENNGTTEDHKEPLVMPKKPAKVIKRKTKEVKLATRHSAKLKKRLI